MPSSVRRVALQSIGLLVVVGALSACSGDGEATQRALAGATATPAPQGAAVGSAGSTATPTGSTADGTTTTPTATTDTAPGDSTTTTGTSGSIATIGNIATGSIATGSIATANIATGDRSASLSWSAPIQNEDGSALIDLAGYRIWYGSASGKYSNVVEIAPGTTSHNVYGLAAATYYFSITAYNQYGVESTLSNEVAITLN